VRTFFRFLLTGLWLIHGGLCGATDIMPLQSEQVATLFNAYRGKPLIVEIWSLDCNYCRDNMKRIVQWQRMHKNVSIIMVSMDTMSDIDELKRVLANLNVLRFPQYVNAESIPEKLRAALDPAWHGEMPRTLFIGKDGKRSASSGLLRLEVLTELLGSH
jgi:hypothetical protein